MPQHIKKHYIRKRNDNSQANAHKIFTYTPTICDFFLKNGGTLRFCSTIPESLEDNRKW